MKNLFDAVLVQATKERILQLHAESKRQWGSMTLGQTLEHCTLAVDMAMGRIHGKRARFPASIIGPLIKPLVFRDDKPMRRNSPSSPELFLAKPGGCELQSECARLIAAINSFATQGAACCSPYPHPFFGKLNPQQWAILMYKHLDHHLRQWGV